jgi:hypothetical protein
MLRSWQQTGHKRSSVEWDSLFDKFKYTDGGVLDRSHLRFLTKKEIVRMFRDEQLEVADLVAIERLTCVEKALHSSKIASRLLANNSFFAL